MAKVEQALFQGLFQIVSENRARVDVFVGLDENWSHSVASRVAYTSLCAQLSPVDQQDLLKSFYRAEKHGSGPRMALKTHARSAP